MTLTKTVSGTFTRLVASTLISALAFGTLGPALAFAATPTNLIPNPSVETSNAAGTLPVGWNKNHATRDTTTFTYPVAGFNSTKAVQVSVSKYFNSDEGWYFNDVAIAPGQYTFADSYIGTVKSDVLVRIRLTNGSFILEKAVVEPATAANTWGRSDVTFTAPARAVSVAIIHSLESTGTLTTDDYSLVSGPTSLPPTPAPVVTPTINSFTATPSSITVGQSTRLAWSVSPTSTLSIAGIGNVIGTSTLVSPTVTTTYVLTAGNGLATTTANALVTVTASTTGGGGGGGTTPPPAVVAPAITSFTATPSSVVSGQASSLAWTLTGSSSTLTINGSAVTGTSLSVSPTATTTYVLVATNTAGSATASTTVVVTPAGSGGTPPPPAAPVITSFTATPTNITSGSNSTLVWALSGATSVTLDNGIGAVVGTSTTVAPTATTTYTLSASNAGGTTTAQVTVNVAPGTVVVTPPPPPNNLIANPTFALGTANAPTSWTSSAWGAAASATFAYPVAGEDDNFAAQVTVPTYPATGLGNGSAEWYFNNVPVTGGSLYTFSDWYKSTANSYLIAAWTLSDNTVEYDAVATLPPTVGTAWQQTTHVFSAPSNAVSVTIFHQLQSVGTLTVDNYTLASGSTESSGLSKAIVSLTFDDGWESQYVNALPILKAANLGGTFYIITSLISTTTPYDFFTDPNEDIATTPVTDGVTFSPIYTDPTVQTMLFEDTYTATAPSTVTVSYVSGSSTVSQVIGTLPAGSNQKAALEFTLPEVSGSTVTPITISHTSTAAMTASAPSLTEYNLGYMTPAELLTLQSAGNEITSHTVTHPDLTALTTAQVNSELTQSKAQLLAWGATPSDGLAYPFGNYSAAIESQTAAAGYSNARTVDIGYNTQTTDKYALKSDSVVATTPIAVVESWIDTAIANKLWLVLTFHDIDSEAIITANGETFGTTPQELQQIVNYLVTKQQGGQLQVATMHNALPLAQ